MQFRIDDSSDAPIYSQIIQQVKGAIAAGEIAPGAKLPTVRKLAVDIGVHVNTVARAYAEMERSGIVTTRPGLGTFVVWRPEDKRLVAEREARLQGIVGQMLLDALSHGYSLDQVEATIALRLAQWRDTVEAREPTANSTISLPANVITIKGSHDIILDLLVGRLRGRTSPVGPVVASSAHIGSLAGLMALVQGEAHVAGCHLLDEETGEYNLPYVKRLLGGQGAVLVNLAYRLQGLIVRRGNPRDITTIQDLARTDVTIVNRQPGSGTRMLLDYKLREAGIGHERIKGYEREEVTHVAVAAAVAGDLADVGLGIMAASRTLELDFIPLWRERYDLAIPRRHYESPLLRPLLDALADESFQHVIELMGGYEATETGRVVGEV